MLVNVSYNNKEITRKVDAEVGKPFTLKERWAMGGIGSPRLFITETSIEIRNLLILDNNRDQCNVEIRPKGIIVRFRSLLETFALVIPFYKLPFTKEIWQYIPSIAIIILSKCERIPKPCRNFFESCWTIRRIMRRPRSRIFKKTKF